MNKTVSGGGRKRRRLSASEKYEVYLSIVTKQATYQEAAAQWGVNRSTITTICKVAKQGSLDALAASVPGNRGKTAEQVALAQAEAEIERLRCHGDRAGGVAASGRGKIAMGLTAGPVPNRVDATVKAGLLGLINHAEAKGWTRRRAAIRLGLDDSRAQRWLGLRQAGHSLADAPGGGNPLHGLLECEREAIIAVFEAWADTDRSHRKLAHRGSRIGMVHVSESTFLRVLRSEQLIPPGNPVREPIPRKPWPDWLVWKPNRIWGYDFTHFTRCQRAVIAVMDIVSRKWLSTVVSAEETSSQIEVAFTDALESEDLLETAWRHGSAELRAAMARGDRETLEQLTTSGDLPLLLTISDNGPQMRSVTTREFMAGVAIAQQFGRPYTPTDQAWIESLFGHVKAEWPQLEQMTDPGELVAELETARIEYNTIRLHESLGYVTPEDEHEGRGEEIRQARRLGLQQARQTRIQYHRQQQAGTP